MNDIRIVNFLYSDIVACDSGIYRFQKIILPGMPEKLMLTMLFINCCY